MIAIEGFILNNQKKILILLFLILAIIFVYSNFFGLCNIAVTFVTLTADPEARIQYCGLGPEINYCEVDNDCEQVFWRPELVVDCDNPDNRNHHYCTGRETTCRSKIKVNMYIVDWITGHEALEKDCKCLSNYCEWIDKQ